MGESNYSLTNYLRELLTNYLRTSPENSGCGEVEVVDLQHDAAAALAASSCLLQGEQRGLVCTHRGHHPQSGNHPQQSAGDIIRNQGIISLIACMRPRTATMGPSTTLGGPPHLHPRLVVPLERLDLCSGDREELIVPDGEMMMGMAG